MTANSFILSVSYFRVEAKLDDHGLIWNTPYQETPDTV